MQLGGGYGQTLSLAVLIVPVVMWIVNDHLSAPYQRLIGPVLADLSQVWPACLLWILSSHLYSQGFRTLMIPIYSIAIGQVAALIPGLVPASLRHSLWTSMAVRLWQLIIIAISKLSTRAFTDRILPSIGKRKYACSFVDVEWMRIVKHEAGGLLRRPVRIYYPCDTSKASSPSSDSRYTAGNKEASRLASLLTGIPSLVFSCRLVSTNAQVSADGLPIPVHDGYPQFPVMIVLQDLNGHSGIGYGLICEELAESGWIVVLTRAPPSRHLSPLFPSEHAVEVVPSGDWHNLNDRMVSHSLDLSFTIDALMAIHYGQSHGSGKEDEHEPLDVGLFKGRLDLERLMVFGHSISASTAIHAASVDRRIRGVIGIDAWTYPLEPLVISSGCACPLLLLQSADRLLTSTFADNDFNLRKLTSNTSNARLYRFKNSNHFDMLDLADIIPFPMKLTSLMNWRDKYRCVDSDMTARVFDYKELVVAFCNDFLRGYTERRNSVQLTPRGKATLRKRFSHGFLRESDDESDAMVDIDVVPVDVTKNIMDTAQTMFPNAVELEKVGW